LRANLIQFRSLANDTQSASLLGSHNTAYFYWFA
jgi:hypothetical protein